MKNVYLDNASTTRPFDEVIDNMSEVMRNTYANPSSAHTMGMKAENILSSAREKVNLLCGGSWQELYFTSGGTESNNWAIFSAIEKMKHFGKSIVLSAVEHPSVREAFKHIEKRGFNVIEIPVDENCQIDIKAFEQAMREDVIFTSIMTVNNETGSIMPIKELYEMKRETSIFHSDCIQAIGKTPLPKVDMISGSGHKIHAPKGVGILAINKDIKIPSMFYGGGQEKNMRSGTENLQSISGLSVASDLMRKVDKSKIADMKNALKKEIVSSIEDVVINTPENSVDNILNVSFLGTKSEVLLHKLEMDNIFVSSGSACSTNKKTQSHVLKAMGLKDDIIDSAIRFSLSSLNSMEDIFYTAEKLKKAVKDMRTLMKFRGRR